MTDFGVLLGLAYGNFVTEMRAALADEGFGDLHRSFGYVAQAALMTHARNRPDGNTANAAGWSDLWERAVVLAFLGAYRDGMAGCPAVPQEDGAFARLLDLFVVQKALSELRHELATRPEWVHIPLRALV